MSTETVLVVAEPRTGLKIRNAVNHAILGVRRTRGDDLTVKDERGLCGGWFSTTKDVCFRAFDTDGTISTPVIEGDGVGLCAY